MGAPDDRSARLDELDRRIRAAREAQQPKRGKTGEKFAMANMAWRMTLELVVGGLVGAAMGWGLDELLGTMPLFLIVFILLGFAAGVRTVMRSAQEVERSQAAEAAEERQAADAAEERQAADAAEERQAADAAEERQAAKSAGKTRGAMRREE